MKIEIENLTIQREPGVDALTNVSCVFDSQQHSSVAILGANGAGKSTLLTAIVGLCPIASGKIIVDGIELKPYNVGGIRRKIGILFQDSDNQLFSQFVREDIAFGPSNLHLSPEEIQARTTAAMEQMNISDLANRSITRLSGGEKRRTALAGILAMNPEAILFDEPTSMLDPRGSRELADIINRLPALKIIASHDLNWIEKTCSECIVLYHGQIYSIGSTADILRNHELLLQIGLA